MSDTVDYLGTFDLGDAKEPFIDWKDKTGAAVDTTTVLTLDKPDGTTGTPTVAHGVTGHYSAVITLDQSGRWALKWVASGAITEVKQAWLYVRGSLAGSP